MTAGKIMMIICAVAFLIGTVGFIKDITVKRRQHQQRKHYAAMRGAETDNE